MYDYYDIRQSEIVTANLIPICLGSAKNLFRYNKTVLEKKSLYTIQEFNLNWVLLKIY